MRFSKVFIVAISVLGLTCVRIDEVKDAQVTVRQTMSSFYMAQETKDVKAISALYAQDTTVVAIGPLSDEQLTGWHQIRNNWKRFFGTVDNVKIWRRDDMIRLNFEGNFAWVLSLNQIEVNRAGVTEMHRYCFSAVMQQTAGQWQFVQTHISIPGLNPVAVAPSGQPPLNEVQEDEPPIEDSSHVVKEPDAGSYEK
ncbi:MAG: nuclear transport factor 2 family protein [Candidatus Zhuqueibacterota bacterium]